MQIQPYLFFDGRCEEAIEFYRKTLDAKVDMLMRYKEAPPAPGMQMPPGDKVMHAALHIGDTQVLRSEEHTSELQSPDHLVCRLLLEKKKKRTTPNTKANSKNSFTHSRPW